MAKVNYAEEYQQALQQPFKQGVRFNELYNTSNNNLVKWVNSKTIQVPNISTGGFVDVDRDKMTNYTRRVDNNWVPLTLEHDREFQTLVDPVDIDETNMALTLSNITQVFNTEHKFPEMDKYAASKLVSELSSKGGSTDETTLDTTNVLSVFDQFMENMDDEEVPTEGRVLYVTPQVNTMLKNAEQIQRSMDVRRAGTSANRNVRSLDEVSIVIVPSSRMKTVYDFTDGATPDGSALQSNMILLHPQSFFAPQRYEFVSLDEPTAATGGKYLYYERKYWDIFLIEQKSGGLKINTESSGA